MFDALNDHEQALLATYAACDDDTARRRARIILLSAEDRPIGEIAVDVDYSTSTVKRWRREWLARGLAIFDGLDVALPGNSGADGATEAVSMYAETDTADHDAGADTGAADDAVEAGEEFDENAAGEASTSESVLIPGVDVPRLPLALRDIVGVEPEDAMAEAGRKVLAYHFERMLLNEPGSRLGEDIEAVHDMRVATRRMRSALRLFAPFFEQKVVQSQQVGLKHVARVLGDVRDLDVLLEKADRFCAENPGCNLDVLTDAWRAQRYKARRRLIKLLDSGKFARFVDALHTFVSTSGAGARPMRGDGVSAYQVRHIAPRLIYEHYEQVRAYDAVLDEAEPPTLHALRIEFKRLRYTLEFFREVLGPEAGSFIKAVKAMQDHLGDLQDAEVAGDMLRDFVDAYNEAHSGTPLFMRPDISGVMAYAEAKEQERAHLMATFPDAWAAFTSEPVRRDLALAVAAL